MNYAGELAAFVAAWGWTISAVCWTAAGKHVGSLVVNTVRMVIATSLFMSYGYLAHGQVLPFTAAAQAWLLLGLSGIIGFFLCDLVLFRSFLIIGPRLAMLIFSLSPIVASICAFYWLEEKLTSMDLCGITIALSGAAWVVLESPRRIKSRAHGKQLLGGITLATLGMLAQGVSNVIAKAGLQHINSAFDATAIRLVTGMICFLILIPVVGKQRECLAVFRNPKILVILIAGSVAGPAMGVALLMYALTTIPTGLAMTFISLTPVMIIPFSVLLFREKVSLRAVLGAIVACVGTVLLLI